MLMTEPQLRAYLLGRLPETEAERLEEKLLQDEELFLTLRSVEDDLFDEHARQELDPSESDAFMNRYGAQNERLAFARALADRRSNVVSFQRWVPLAAAAAITLTIGALMLVEDRGTVPPARPVVRAAPAAPITRSVVLTLGSSRSAGEITVVELPRNASTLNVRVRLDPNDIYDRYALELRQASSDSVVWRADGLQAIREGEDLAVSAGVPGSILDGGAYELAVHGGNEPLGFVTMEIRRTQ
jgi:anti-sigma-K factor RskA